jgi:hypothetical protein
MCFSDDHLDVRMSKSPLTDVDMRNYSKNKDAIFCVNAVLRI